MASHLGLKPEPVAAIDLSERDRSLLSDPQQQKALHMVAQQQALEHYYRRSGDW